MYLIVYCDKKTNQKGYCLRNGNTVIAFGHKYISKIVGLPLDIMKDLDVGVYRLELTTQDYIKKF